MGYCINLRRGMPNRLPVLNPNYPEDITVIRSNGTITHKVEIASDGRPAEYTYQWYWYDPHDDNYTAILGGNKAVFTQSANWEAGERKLYCEVTNAVGTVQSRVATITFQEALLFNSGDVYATSGGWQFTSATESSSYAPTTKYSMSPNLYLEFPENCGMMQGALLTKNKIDLTNYSKIRFTVNKSRNAGSAYNWYMGATTNGTAAKSGAVATYATTFGSADNTVRTFDVDVSNVSEPCHIGMWFYTMDQWGWLSVSKIELIP